MSDKLKQSRTDGPHKLLASMVGEWRGVAKTWFEPGKIGDESPVEGTTRLIANGNFLLHEYEGTLMGGHMQGLAIIGYYNGGKRWQTAWVNNHHNGTRIMVSEGKEGAPTDKPNVLGSYPAGDGSPDWGWRTTLELRSPDNLVLMHYNITPEGEESPAVEFDYKRVQG
ncbi:MAG: DUF1579 domain-containing protein [Planctomycetes bacterium]|nr:DUF1579 domain-containing protein [Planctomycetota bacterium]